MNRAEIEAVAIWIEEIMSHLQNTPPITGTLTLVWRGAKLHSSLCRELERTRIA